MEEKILAALAELNGKFDTMHSDLQDMKADIADMKTDMAEVKAEQKAMKADIAEVKAEQKAMKADIAGLKTEQTMMTKQIHENHMMLSAIREAQELTHAELDQLLQTTASRESVDLLRMTLANGFMKLGKKIAGV